jgi:hypothetical protein
MAAAAKRVKSFIPCTVKQLHPSLWEAAAKTAREISPRNAPAIQNLSAFMSGELIDQLLTPARIAALTDKYWGPAGVDLSVSFMETTRQDLADRILSHMNAWGPSGAGGNVRFRYVASDGDVRISRGPGGYWSYIGTDIRHIARNEPTMNLEGFVMATPESEYKRVVRHETGHTLGCPHEHMRAAIVALLNPSKTINYFRQTQGWSAEEVRQQVLTPLDERSLMGTPTDVTSIMCYQLPASITTNNKPIPGGNDINASDAEFIRKICPLAAGPVDPPTGGGDPPAADVRVLIEISKKSVTLPDGKTYAWK